MMYPESCISFLADAGSGHFEIMPETAEYIAMFIKKSMQHRLNDDGTLRKVRQKDGWLACRGKQQRSVGFGDARFSADGQTLTVTATPGAHIEVICGPLRKVTDTTFRVYPYECGLDNPRRSFTAWIVAVLDGDETYKRAVKPLEIKIPKQATQ